VGVADRNMVVIGLCGIAALMALLAVTLDSVGYDWTVAIVIAAVLVLGGWPASRWFAAKIGLPRLAGLIYGGLWAKLVASVLRYFMVYTLYGGLGDSKDYDVSGWDFAQRVRGGDLFPVIDLLEGREDSTRRLVKTTGYMYSIIGHSIHGAFFLFAFAAFVGTILAARGMQLALPEADPKRLYGWMLFFPSLLFWPAAVGKDAVMVLFLGLVILGAGMFLGPKARVSGVVPFGLGMGGMLFIRPHVGLMAIASLAIAVALSVIASGSPERNSAKARTIRIGLLIVVVLGSIAALSQVASFFDEKAGESTSMEGAFQETLRRTQVGNSKFVPVTVSGPQDVPAAVVSVFFRPFPWEVANLANLLAGVEGLSLIVALAFAARRLRSWPRLAKRRPILVFAAVYVTMFAVGFTNIGNFGILARQRTQALPLIVFLMALPLVDDVLRARSDDDALDVTVDEPAVEAELVDGRLQ
jgi:hypothetical protein